MLFLNYEELFNFSNDLINYFIYLILNLFFLTFLQILLFFLQKFKEFILILHLFYSIIIQAPLFFLSE